MHAGHGDTKGFTAVEQSRAQAQADLDDCDSQLAAVAAPPPRTSSWQAEQARAQAGLAAARTAGRASLAEERRLIAETRRKLARQQAELQRERAAAERRARLAARELQRETARREREQHPSRLTRLGRWLRGRLGGGR